MVGFKAWLIVHLIFFKFGYSCSPPTGYTLIENSYYKTSTVKLQQHEAVAACQADGAQLATFKTETELRALLNEIKNHDLSEIWINLYHVTMELCQSDNNLYPDCDDNFFWADGTFASEIYSNPLININDMDGNGPNGCMRLRWNVYIGDKSCINTLPYVCQYRCEQENVLTPSRCADNSPVPAGYNPWKGKLYKDVRDLMNFDAAKANCQADGGRLLSPAVREEYQMVKFLRDTTGSIYYIGLDNRNDENCVNEGCNGKLFLMDNTPFTYNTSFMTSNVTAESGYFTFKVISNAHLLGSTTSVSRFSVCVLDCGLIVDGGWGAWSSWSSCLKPATEKTRVRLCNEPPPQGGGSGCPGISSESLPCPASCLGPPGYTWSGRYHFKRVSSSTTYMTARQDCEADGARLARFHDSEDFAHVRQEQLAMGLEIWIGLLHNNNVFCEAKFDCYGHFAWDDGSSANDLWSIYEVDDLDGNGPDICVRMEHANRLGDKGCELNRAYLCQYDCDNVYDGNFGHSCPGGTVQVPPYFTPWDSKYYRLFGAMNNSEAEKICTHYGSVVSTLKTATTRIYSLMHTVLSAEANFIGLHDPTNAASCTDEGCDNVLQWSDGTPFVFDPAIMTMGITAEPGKACFAQYPNSSITAVPCGDVLRFSCMFDCTAISTAVDGNWGEWSPWSGCVGAATSKQRSRACDSPEPSHFGADCIGTTSESLLCDPAWMDWSPWSSCSKTCGYGVEKRSRGCNFEGQCSGSNKDIRYCTSPACTGSDQAVFFTKYDIDTPTWTSVINNLTEVMDLSDNRAFSHELLCSMACFNLRPSSTDFAVCNSFVIDGLTCYFGFSNESLVQSVIPGESKKLFFDFDF